MFTRPQIRTAFLLGVVIGWNKSSDIENFYSPFNFLLLIGSAFAVIFSSDNNDVIISSKLKNMFAIVTGLVVGQLLYSISNDPDYTLKLPSIS